VLNFSGATNMKKIGDYRKLLDVSKSTGLAELKTIYRNSMKDWHPDKFQDSDDRKLEAEEKSKAIIEAYHFLVSIAPETQSQMLPEYTLTITSSNIADIEYSSQTLKITFLDGSIYEYFDVPRLTYTKLINAESRGRFARRHIFNEFVYRNISKPVTS
jgi:curved DNA-binding protein CbpA